MVWYLIVFFHFIIIIIKDSVIKIYYVTSDNVFF